MNTKNNALRTILRFLFKRAATNDNVKNYASIKKIETECNLNRGVTYKHMKYYNPQCFLSKALDEKTSLYGISAEGIETLNTPQSPHVAFMRYIELNGGSEDFTCINKLKLSREFFTLLPKDYPKPITLKQRINAKQRIMGDLKKNGYIEYSSDSLSDVCDVKLTKKGRDALDFHLNRDLFPLSPRDPISPHA